MTELSRLNRNKIIEYRHWNEGKKERNLWFKVDGPDPLKHFLFIDFLMMAILTYVKCEVIPHYGFDFHFSND